MAGLGLAPTAAARPPQPGLNWVRLPGAETCINAHAMAQGVEQRLGRPVFGPASEADLFVDGVAEATSPSGYRVRLWISDRAGRVLGQRSLATERGDCRELDQGLTLVIAVTLYPTSELSGGGIALAPEVSAEFDALFRDEPSELDPAALPAAEPAAVDRAARARGTDTQSRAKRANANATARAGGEASFRAGIDLAGQVAVGLAPGPLPGAALIVGLERAGLLRVEARASLWLPGEATAPLDAGRSAFRIWLVDALACSDGQAFLLGGRVCLGGRLGSVTATPSGFAFNGPRARDLVLAGLLQLLLRRPLIGDLYYRLSLVIGVPIVRRQYFYSTPEVANRLLYRAPAINAQLGAGLGWSF